MDFYRLSDCCGESELTIEVRFNFRYGSHDAFKKIAQKYYVTAWFEMEDGITAEFGDFKLRRPRKRSDIVKLRKAGRIATAENSWHAIVVNGQIGWVSGKYAEVI